MPRLVNAKTVLKPKTQPTFTRHHTNKSKSRRNGGHNFLNIHTPCAVT
jgi:hypothetical protein